MWLYATLMIRSFFDPYNMYIPENNSPSRDGEREHHLGHINFNHGNVWPYNEDILEKYLHIKYDEFDMNEELLKKFECREVVDYLLTFLDRDSIRELLLMSCGEQKETPLSLLSFHCYDIENKREIFETIYQIYHRNSMEGHAFSTKMICEWMKWREGRKRFNNV